MQGIYTYIPETNHVPRKYSASAIIIIIIITTTTTTTTTKQEAGGSTIRCAIHKLIIVIWNKEELPGEWKESIIVPIHKKGDKTDCNNYTGISILPTTYKILSNILLSRLSPHAEEIIGGSSMWIPTQ